MINSLAKTKKALIFCEFVGAILSLSTEHADL